MGIDVRSVLTATGLPLVGRLEEIAAAVAERRLAVVRADPGSGKSTLLPLALMASSSFSSDRILILEPRRVAAASVASRMAELLGEDVGGRVGYSVRLERRVGKNTRVEVVTEGLLVRRLLADPGLEGVGAILFDEFHERSTHSDLALALSLDLRRLRPELALLVMSATMDGERVASFLSEADAEASGKTLAVPLIDCPGRPFPVSVEYSPLPGRRPLGEECADAVLRVLGERQPDAGADGDALVFLPGRREIEDASAAIRRALGGRGDSSIEVRALHGSMALSEQRDLLRPRPGSGRSGKRRVVFATNIAETSLTVPGVSIVIDSGLVKTQRFHVRTGLDRLVSERASERTCDQRTGRAGRLGPGRCVRLWAPSDARPRETESEILRSDAAPLVLDCALWGVRRPSDLRWLDPPPAAAWETASELLRELGALDSRGSPTARGERMARLGVHPRLAAVALAGEAARSPGVLSLACAAAAVLSDRDLSQVRDDADFRLRLSLLRSGSHAGRTEPGTAAWRSRAADLAFDLASRLEAEEAQAARLFRWSAEEEASVGSLLLSGFPDRVARRQESLSYRFPSGREVRVEGPLSAEEWLVAVDAEAGERTGKAYLAAPVNREEAERTLSFAYPESKTEEWLVEWEGLVPRAKLVRRAGRLLLSERRAPATSEALETACAALLESKGLPVLPWDEGDPSPRRFLERARFWARAVGDDVLSLSLGDESLAKNARTWVGPFFRPQMKAGAPAFDAAALTEALKSLTGWEKAARIEREAPERLETPAGTRRRLDYSGDTVALDVRIQEVFGLAETPRVAGVPVLLRLLSPAERPLQVTADLAGFWRGTYAEVRKEMRGRYPRHYWPENPLVAEPTSRPKPRGT